MSQRIILAFAGPRRLKDDPSGSLLPLGLTSMASVLEKAGHEVEVVHLARFSNKDALRFLSEGAPDIVGFSCFTFQRKRTLEMARRLREHCGSNGPLILLGGPHASPLAGEILKRTWWVDGVVEGEGENTLLELASSLDKGQKLTGIPGLWVKDGDKVVKPPRREFIEDLDELPSTALSNFSVFGVDPDYQHRHLVSARGCNGKCRFCYAPGAWSGRIRSHSADRILSEVRSLRERKGLVYFSFRDDTFTLDPAWTTEFCKQLIESGADILWDCQSRIDRLDHDTVALMRKAGCVQIQLGVESGSESIIKFLRKPFDLSQVRLAAEYCRKAALPMSFYLICGVPGESRADIGATEKLVEELKPASVVVSRLAVYPGTALSAGIDPAIWFEDKRESIFVREDREAVDHEKYLYGLSDRISGEEPYSVNEIAEASGRLENPAPVLLSLGHLYERLEDFENAEKVYRKILDKRQGYIWAELDLGSLLLESERPDDALPHLKRVVDSVPLWPYPLDRYGWALSLTGNEAEGRARIERAQQINPMGSAPPPPV